MRARICVLALVAPFAVALAPSAAHATTRYCDGEVANIVGTDGPDTQATVTGTHNPLGDVVWLGGGNDQYSGGAGNDIICGGAGADGIAGGAGNDTILGETGNDLLAGGLGDDSISGGGDAKDVLTYGNAATGVTVHAGAQTVDGEGHDTYAGIAIVRGSTHADTMVGSAGRDWFEGDGGADTLTGNGGSDVLFDISGVMHGGAGNDLVIAWGGVGHGDAGNDTIRIRNSGAGYGDDGNDLFYVGRGAPHAYGGGGNDEFAMRSVNYGSVLHGGSGSNAITFHQFKTGVKADLGAGTAAWGNGHTVSFTRIHGVTGTSHGDRLVGSSGSDLIYGDPGNDTLIGKGGNDLLIGGGDTDSADGGAGGDVCKAERIRACEAR
ncbi:calcium-binding protein [Nocardioides montaniterrae]